MQPNWLKRVYLPTLMIKALATSSSSLSQNIRAINVQICKQSSVTMQVFADHDSSYNPIDVPRQWIWNLPRRTAHFGASVMSIFRGKRNLDTSQLKM